MHQLRQVQGYGGSKTMHRERRWWALRAAHRCDNGLLKGLGVLRHHKDLRVGPIDLPGTGVRVRHSGNRWA